MEGAPCDANTAMAAPPSTSVGFADLPWDCQLQIFDNFGTVFLWRTLARVCQAFAQTAAYMSVYSVDLPRVAVIHDSDTPVASLSTAEKVGDVDVAVAV